ncbi:unknown [Euproctis pseudoconspersa nucleopolyhedrovirus]|uniref:Chitin-binding type-4 domain-containing protein n=1 Tax=Euproctis pseudoconspersa nucleopolyhedrovirus TaxID=307467 RepID=C3TWS8_9ABAC|nr:hypothetical protein EupsNPV_gp020 [Euproctis pseudoconspersa nucleopolyhedrovirus]ACO53470.1 unknown [Euproctis pseudoconspersa nucleopolyhedrovirus]QUJ09213.1 hypothetical protein Gyru_ORF18 [Gynaephora ruoergensis nucleopolyhedrovirus]
MCSIKCYYFATILVVVSLTNPVNCHGYLSWPAARQFKCYRDGKFWWPDNGDAIPDDACRSAYKTVYTKYINSGESHGAAANAAQYMFQQYYEYAALAGPNHQDFEYVKKHVIPDSLCAAGARNRSHVFGDKSGVDEPFGGAWRAQTLHLLKYNEGVNVILNFCPTTEHDPSYFQVFITKPEYDYSHKLDWDDLEALDSDGFVLSENDGFDEACAADRLYKIPVVIPFRSRKFMLFVRWQRDDVAGEGFYNCADLIYNDAQNLIYDDYLQNSNEL